MKNQEVTSNAAQNNQPNHHGSAHDAHPASFTPGPWRINSNIGRKSELGILANSAPCIIAVMGNAKEWPTQAEANARLIAAAPALFEALKAFEKGLTDGSIKWARPRQSDSDPYHPANTLMCAALELVEVSQ